MEYSQEEKIKIQIENNNCIISTLKSSKTNSNTSTNKNTKASSLKKVSKNLLTNLDNEVSFSISNSSNDDLPNNNKDISMLEITDKSIFFSDMNLNNGSMLNKTPETKIKSGKDKKIRKMKEAVVRKLNFERSKNNNLKIKKENKYPLLKKIILDYQHLYKPKEKIKCNFIKKRITKKIKMNLNFKEINFHKQNSFKGSNNNFVKEEEKCITISSSNYGNNYYKKKNISSNSIFDNSKPISSNIRSSFKLSKKNSELKVKKTKDKKNIEFRKQLSSSMNCYKNKYVQKYKDRYKEQILSRLDILYIHRDSFFNNKNCLTNLKSINNSSILNTNCSNDIDDISKKLNVDNIKLSFVKNKLKRKLTKTSNNSISHTLNKNKNISLDNRPKKSIKKYNYRNPTQVSTYRSNLNVQNNKKIMFKNLLKIFGKELYNQINSKNNDKTFKNHNIINNFNLLNIINNNEIKLENISIKRKREKKSSYSLIK
jgi:hypothetical protein